MNNANPKKAHRDLMNNLLVQSVGKLDTWEDLMGVLIGASSGLVAEIPNEVLHKVRDITPNLVTILAFNEAHHSEPKTEDAYIFANRLAMAFDKIYREGEKKIYES